MTEKRDGGPEGRSAAVFLDRDGTIIEDRGDLRSPEQIALLPGAVGALLRLQQHFRLFIVTNQSGIGKGSITAAQAESVNRALTAELGRRGVVLDEVFTCPHARPTDCACRKPNPHFLRVAADRHRIDPARSYVVGDHPHDIEFAERGGAKGVYVCTGHGGRHLAELPAGRLTVPSLEEAADWILADALPWHCAEEDVEAAAEILRAGGLVAFPTETVYGLGADALRPEAVARIFAAKERPYFDPLIVHLPDRGHLPRIAAGMPRDALRLAERFWPGPLTLVLPKRDLVPDIVTSGLPSVALRVPDHPVALALLRRAGVPLAAPSANRFGRISPTTARHVAADLGNRVDAILNGGPCRLGVESTVVSFVDDRPRLLRPGGVPQEEVEALIGPLTCGPADPSSPAAPGMLPRHYAPRTPLVISEQGSGPKGARTGLLSLLPPADAGDYEIVEVLSPDGRLEEAAARLFAAMRRLDASGLDLIVARPFPERGLGRAINDRLRRASAPEGEA